METEKKPQAAGVKKHTPQELNYINALDQIDTELRKARQIINEFFGDIVTHESRYPSFDDMNRSLNDDNPLFKIILDYPRYVTLLEAAADYLSEGHMIAINALVNGGTRKSKESYVR